MLKTANMYILICFPEYLNKILLQYTLMFQTQEKQYRQDNLSTQQIFTFEINNTVTLIEEQGTTLLPDITLC